MQQPGSRFKTDNSVGLRRQHPGLRGQAVVRPHPRLLPPQVEPLLQAPRQAGEAELGSGSVQGRRMAIRKPHFQTDRGFICHRRGVLIHGQRLGECRTVGRFTHPALVTSHVYPGMHTGMVRKFGSRLHVPTTWLLVHAT